MTVAILEVETFTGLQNFQLFDFGSPTFMHHVQKTESYLIKKKDYYRLLNMHIINLLIEIIFECVTITNSYYHHT